MITAKAYDEKPRGLAGLVETLREKLQDSLFDKKEFTVTTRRTSKGYQHEVVYEKDVKIKDIPTYMGEVINIQEMNEKCLDLQSIKDNVESTYTKYKFRPSKLFK